MPVITVFKFLCLAQIMVSLNALNSFVHNAQGRPKWSLSYHGVSAISMAVSFYFAVKYGLDAILIPWFTTYIAISCGWIILTSHKIGVNFLIYVKNLSNPIMATLAMIAAIQLYSYSAVLFRLELNLFYHLVMKVGIGAFSYISYLWLVDKKLFYALRKLWKV